MARSNETSGSEMAGDELDLKLRSSADLGPTCRLHGIRKLSVFGSRLKGTERADSDLDLLVEFASGRVPGLLGLSAIEIELSRILGLRVDLRTAQDLSPYFRDEVVRQARVAYAGRG